MEEDKDAEIKRLRDEIVRLKDAEIARLKQEIKDLETQHKAYATLNNIGQSGHPYPFPFLPFYF